MQTLFICLCQFVSIILTAKIQHRVYKFIQKKREDCLCGKF